MVIRVDSNDTSLRRSTSSRGKLTKKQAEQRRLRDEEVIRQHETNIQNEARDLRRLRRQTNRQTSSTENTEPENENTTSTNTGPTITRMSTKKNLPDFFVGEYSKNEKPEYWLRNLERSWESSTKDEEKIRQFELSLAPGREAETWFDDLSQADKADWKALKKAFQKRWPLEKVKAESKEMMMAKLREMQLEAGDVGKLVEKDGEEEYAHVMWARKLKRMAIRIGDDNGLLIASVRERLPPAVRALMPAGSEDSWEKFTEGLVEISVERVKERIEEERRNDMLVARVDHLTQLYDKGQGTPMTQLTRSFSGMGLEPVGRYQPYSPTAPRVYNTTPTTGTANSIQQQTQPTQQPRQPQTPGQRPGPPYPTPYTPRQPQTPTSRQNDPFLASTSTVRPSSLTQRFTYQAQNSPLANRGMTATQHNASRAALNSLMYPNNAEGQRQYVADMARWNSTYGEIDPEVGMAPFPLTPGTAKLGSKECFACGMATPPHLSESCANQRIPERETRWRSRINNMMYPRGERTGTPNRAFQYATVAQMGASMDLQAQDEQESQIVDAESMVFEEWMVEQGNGAELR